HSPLPPPPPPYPTLFRSHTNAPMALSRALVHDMMRQRWGRIVNVTTSLGTMIRDGAPTYGPSKAALEAFSAIMAKDLAGTGVTRSEEHTSELQSRFDLVC